VFRLSDTIAFVECDYIPWEEILVITTERPTVQCGMDGPFNLIEDREPKLVYTITDCKTMLHLGMNIRLNGG
jgi:hypothetical protein